MLFTKVFTWGLVAGFALAAPADPLQDENYVANLMGDNKDADVDTVVAAMLADMEGLNTNSTVDIATRDLDGFDLEDRDLDPRDLEARDATGRCLPWKTAKSKGVKVVPNGCGPKWASFVPEFTYGACCNHHDRCYSTCSRSRASCDNAFFKCMVSDCHSRYKVWNPKRFACDQGAGVFYRAVRSKLGAAAFVLATKKHCKCV